jgi:flagellar protein FlgJ
MMDDKISLSSRVYTDIQGLKQLQYHADSPAAKKEVAQQFESLLMQMVLSSMREANKAFSGGSTNQMDMYQDLFDKQISLSMSTSGQGFAGMVEKSIDQMQSPHADTSKLAPQRSVPTAEVPAKISEVKAVAAPTEVKQVEQPMNKPAPAFKPEAVEAEKEQETFSSPEDFMKKLWASAKHAASLIGASPELLLAQAALETNWGKNIIPDGKDTSTHNLFNVKAGSGWNNKVATIKTLEEKDGVIAKEKSNFRSYASFKESFMDYVNLLKKNDRYSESVSKAGNPEQFTSALQSAGYATDQNYANKIMKIFSSHGFQDIVTKIKSGL